jgi:hypothetical protein
MAGPNCFGRKFGGEGIQQISSMHAVDAIPTRRVRGDDWTDNGAVSAVVPRAAADFCSNGRQGFAESYSRQLSKTVRKKEHARPDLAERSGLLEDRDVDTSVKQRARSGKPSNSAAHYGGAKAPSPPRFVFHVKSIESSN